MVDTVHPLEASDMNFQIIWIPKGILAKFLSEKTWSWNHSYLKYAVETYKKKMNKHDRITAVTVEPLELITSKKNKNKHDIFKAYICNKSLKGILQLVNNQCFRKI